MIAILDRRILKWGAVPVPYAALWSGEAGKMHVSICPHAGVLAVCDHEARGTGKPIFGKPHMTRQREVIINQCCDLCAHPLAGRTKVSLSHATFRVSGAEGGCVMQVEPLVHKDCALICVEHCPSLKRDIQAGTLFVRQVHRHRAQVLKNIIFGAEQTYMIWARDNEAYYRSQYSGYTTDRIRAGKYTREEAEAECRRVPHELSMVCPDGKHVRFDRSAA